VHLLETTLIRVGNDDYARQNNSYGLTTLKNRHVAIEGNEIRSASLVKAANNRRCAYATGASPRSLGPVRSSPGRSSFSTSMNKVIARVSHRPT
jgi:DNA topoisomerase IB